MTTRRQFVTLIGGAAATWPAAARAQQAARLPTIGFLGTGSASTWSKWVAAFVQRLHQLGWVEGRTVAIEYRWAEGRPERYPEIAAEFVRRKVDVIVTSGGAVPAAKQATSVIPIVFAIAPDAVASGMVASLARPGGNATGLSGMQTDLVGKRLELLRQLVPAFRRIAIMANAGYPAAMLNLREVRDIAGTLGLDVVTREIRRAEDIAPVFAAPEQMADAVYVVGDPLTTTNQARIGTLALAARLPTMNVNRDFVEAGGLMSYGPNFSTLFRRAAEIVDKILRGTKPADIPIEQPTTFDLVINLKTAKALGLEVPPMLLVRADEVIE